MTLIPFKLNLVDDQANRDVDLGAPTPQHVTVRILNEGDKEASVEIVQTRTDGEPIVKKLTALAGCYCSDMITFGVLPVTQISVTINVGDTVVLSRNFAVNWRGQRLPEFYIQKPADDAKAAE